MDISKLDAVIRAVCPIDGVSVGRKADKSTWRIDFKPKATKAERAAAQAALVAFDKDAPENQPKEPVNVEAELAALKADVAALTAVK